MQRRGAVGCDDVDVNALLQERLHRGAVPVPGGLDKGRDDLGIVRLAADPSKMVNASVKCRAIILRGF